MNLSCQGVSPKQSKDMGSLGLKAMELKMSMRKQKTTWRYQEIPPEEFIYENESPSLTKGLVNRINTIMRRGSRLRTHHIFDN